MGLTDTEVEEYMHKLETEKGANPFNSFNW
jgi:hypothetical protein